MIPYDRIKLIISKLTFIANNLLDKACSCKSDKCINTFAFQFFWIYNKSEKLNDFSLIKFL